jgi:hypothetical protein
MKRMNIVALSGLRLMAPFIPKALPVGCHRADPSGLKKGKGGMG